MEKKIFITMDGGLIQNVLVTDDLDIGLHVVVVDMDTEGLEDQDVTILPDGDEAFIHEAAPEVISDGDMGYWEQVLRNFGCEDEEF